MLITLSASFTKQKSGLNMGVWRSVTYIFILTEINFLQHFPMYRESDRDCFTPDAAPEEEKSIPFREKWDCVSKESTEMVWVETVSQKS